MWTFGFKRSFGDRCDLYAVEGPALPDESPFQKAGVFWGYVKGYNDFDDIGNVTKTWLLVCVVKYTDPTRLPSEIVAKEDLVQHLREMGVIRGEDVVYWELEEPKETNDENDSK